MDLSGVDLPAGPAGSGRQPGGVRQAGGGEAGRAAGHGGWSRPAQAGPAQAGPAQAGPIHAGLPHIGPSRVQVETSEAGLFHVGLDGLDDRPGLVGALLGFGREADVYALDSGRVLRRYRHGGDATAEAELMGHLAAHGFPVPRVDEARGADMIMERLDGRTMAAAFTAGEIGVDESAALLADLHQRLHALPPRTGGVPGDRILHALPLATGGVPGDRILHRDLHPENVMLTSRGPVVIDWHNAAEGPPDVDVCLTVIILAQVAAEPAEPRAAVIIEFISAFLARIGGDPLAALDEALRIRRTDPSLTPEESAALAATVTPVIRDAVAYGPP